MVIAALTGVWGCGGGDDGVTPPSGTTQDLINLIATLVPPEFVTPSNVEAGKSLLATMSVEGKVHAFGVLQNGLDLVNGGDVWVRGRAAADPPETTEVKLDIRSTPVNGVSQFVYSTLPSHATGLVLPFDGTAYHRFRVTGSSQFPAATDSAQSVIGIDPTSPPEGANVPRNTELHVVWSDAGSDTSVYVAAMVYRTSDPTQRRLSGVVRDTDGHLPISSGLLSAFPAGDATLVVVRYRLRYVGSGVYRTGYLLEAGDARPIVLL